jgi:hypothetical protein
MAKSGFFSQTGSDAGALATVQSKIDEAEAAKVAAEAAQAASEAAQASSEAARNTSQTHRDTAEDHKDETLVAKNLTETARDTTLTYKNQALAYRDEAETHKDDASTSATAAAASESDAGDHASDAQKLSINPEDSQFTLSDGSTTAYSALHYSEKANDAKLAAEIAETNAETAEAGSVAAKNLSVTAKNESETAQVASEAAQADSESARDDAEAAETNAAASATAAANSASSASSSSATATTKATEASSSAGTSTTKASEASNSATSAATAQSAAEAARDSALAALDSFDDRYLGVKSSAPTLDNDGNALASGALYFSSTDDAMKVFSGSQWLNAYASLSGALIANQNLSDLTNAGAARTNLGISTVGNTGAFSDLTGTPTTLSGYGITDALQLGTTSTTALAGNTSIPSGLTDLSITDGSNGQALKTDGAGNFSFGDVATSTAWNDITNKPTTLWHGGNDGSGSGLDADLLDGQEGSYYYSSANLPSKLFGGGTSPSAENLNTVGDNVSVGQLEYRGFNSSTTNAPPMSDNANGVITVGQHSGDYNAQLAFSSDGNMYWRDNPSTTYGSWREVWDSGNDGSGSGLDADTVDGIQASSFLRSDAADTMTGELTISGTSPQMKFNDTNSEDDFWIHVNSNNFYILTDRDDNGSWDGSHPLQLTNATSTIQSYGNTVWTSGNDGSGSGLDADTVDGIQASSFLRSDADDNFTNALISTARNNGIFGTYDSTKTDHIWSMGAAYKNAADGSDFGNLHGLAYKHTNNSTGGTMAGSHQMVWCHNGVGKAALGSNIWTSGNVTAYSDIRVKTNIEHIPDALSKVCELNGYTFDRTDVTFDENGVPDTPPRQTGVIAQEVLEVLPEAVIGDEEGHYSVAYGNMVGILIEAIKELKNEIETLKGQM